MQVMARIDCPHGRFFAPAPAEEESEPWTTRGWLSLVATRIESGEVVDCVPASPGTGKPLPNADGLLEIEPMIFNAALVVKVVGVVV